MSIYFHFSEDADIKMFLPRKPTSFPEEPPLVWAIDEEHRPLYLFPRDCPRIAFWKGDHSSVTDVERFRLNTRMVIVIESDWLKRLEDAVIYEYTFTGDGFTCFDRNAGYYTSQGPVVPNSVRKLDGLIQHLMNEGIELRWLPSLKTTREEVSRSTLSFSMIRMRNVKN